MKHQTTRRTQINLSGIWLGGGGEDNYEILE